MNDDFGKLRPEAGSDRSQTPEDATIHGQPAENQPGVARWTRSGSAKASPTPTT